MPKVGLLWRAEWDPPIPHKPGAALVASCRLSGVFAAFAALSVAAEPVVYSDDRVELVRQQLLQLDGVLVWVNPIEHGLDRSRLDRLLRDVADAGVWVSAHPDVILKMATKRVLYDTRKMSWGTDTRVYTSTSELREELPRRLGGGSARVLKQQRGMGGKGVWKVELDGWGDDPLLRVRQATRDATTERLPLSEFVARCKPYFDEGALMVEQPFQERISDGMIRVYLTHDTVVGFAHQYPAGLRSESAGEPPPGKVFELATATGYEHLRNLMESSWVPELQQLLGIETAALPVIWDADFLYGPPTASGKDTYLLCEVNASSTFAFPEHAMSTVAEAALRQLAARADRRAGTGSERRQKQTRH